MSMPGWRRRKVRVSGSKRGNVMNRFLLGIVGVLVAVWLIFAVFNAVKGLIHLALVIAILLIAYNLLMSLRNRSDEID